MKKMLIAAVAGIASLGMLASPASADGHETIAEAAAGAGEFNNLLAALQAAGLDSTFADASAGPFTVFAPTDAAFAAALANLNLTAEQLLADTATLTTILQYHVLDGAVKAETVVTLDGQKVATLGGEEITIGVSGTSVTLNGNVNVVQTDIGASNGVIHVIDAVLIPPSLLADQELPATGSNNGQFALIAAGLLAGGAGFLLISRRRATA